MHIWKKKKKNLLFTHWVAPLLSLANSHPSQEIKRLCCFKLDARHAFFLFYDNSSIGKFCYFLYNVFFFICLQVLSSLFPFMCSITPPPWYDYHKVSREGTASWFVYFFRGELFGLHPLTQPTNHRLPTHLCLRKCPVILTSGRLIVHFPSTSSLDSSLVWMRRRFLMCLSLKHVVYRLVVFFF